MGLLVKAGGRSPSVISITQSDRKPIKLLGNIMEHRFEDDGSGTPFHVATNAGSTGWSSERIRSPSCSGRPSGVRTCLSLCQLSRRGG